MIKQLNQKVVVFFDKTFYPTFQDNWDDKAFREVILSYISDDTILLDIGAGRGIIEYMNFRGIAKKVYGVDPVDEVKENPYVDEAFVGLGDSMPFFEDEMFDVIISDNVLEHVEHPETFYKEVSRVLKKGGVFISKTPNKYHYLPLVATLTPMSFHNYFNALRGREAEDTFPTKYLANTSRKQTKLAKANDMKPEKFEFIEGRPEYLRISFITYPFGILYERIVNGLRLNQLKIVIVSVLRKNQ